jgi:S-adenosylmethionine hydrolase
LGVPVEDLGPATTDFFGGNVSQPQVRQGRIEGKIIYVDHFGNGISNIDQRTIEQVFPDGKFHVNVFDYVIFKIQRTYAEAEDGEALALVGSSGLLEIAVKNGSAEYVLGLTTGTEIILSPKE